METNQNNDADFLKSYIEEPKFGSKFWLRITIFAIIILFIVIFWKEFFNKSISKKQVKASISFSDIHSLWVQKQTFQNEETKGIILVPQAHFRITNIGTKEFHNIAIIGVFTFLDIANVKGEGYHVLKEKKLKPQDITEPIILTSDRGYQASSKEAFRDNKNWKRASVRLFVRTEKGMITYLDTFYISQKIEGMNIDVKLTN